MSIIVTGGAGFIGTNFILDWFEKSNEKIINIDSVTYSGNIKNLKHLEGNENFVFFQYDINNKDLIKETFLNYKPRAIINFAAESHVDKSIISPENFIHTNIFGVYNLLEVSREYWGNLTLNEKRLFRFYHISTDEVYGDLKPDSLPFNEENTYLPSSPYSASKAASDHLVRAWNRTFGLPTLISNCSNNYGPYQYPEKLIPLCINNALQNKKIPIYGDGKQLRDWIYVKDHCCAIREVLEKGRPGETYNIGGNNEKTNLEIVNKICEILDKLNPNNKYSSYKNLITHIEDRPGHDRRYSVDSTKIKKELGWKPHENFESGIVRTIKWYKNNLDWLES
tara:strand:+ start:17 stop:1030 length:1014 start_codon:yes stop_codon:yes gene_type:complete